MVALEQKRFDEAEKQFRHCIDARKQSNQNVSRISHLFEQPFDVQTIKGDFVGAEKSLNEAFTINKKIEHHVESKELCFDERQLCILVPGLGQMGSVGKILVRCHFKTVELH